MGAPGADNSTPDQQLSRAERVKTVIDLRRRGLSYQAIGDELGISKARAHQIWSRALEDIPKPSMDQYRALELERLEKLEETLVSRLQDKFPMVSHGRVMKERDPSDPTGMKQIPLEDVGPMITIVDKLRALSESRRKLLGLDAPAKVEQTGDAKVHITYSGFDPDAV